MKIKNILLISVMASLFLCILGCGSKYKEGYIIDKGKKQVIWRTVDAGYGVREKIVQGADLKTFEILKFTYDPYFKRNSFAKDKQHVYWQGCIIKDADPKTFRYEQNIYKDDKQSFICDSSLGFLPKSFYNESPTTDRDVSVKKEKTKSVYIQKKWK